VLSNDAALSTELSTRIAADNSIAANLSSELVDRAAAVSTEASLRVLGDESIAANLSSELVDRAAAVSTEASLRVLGDESIATTLSVYAENETNDRQIADASLETLLSTEVSRATSTELSLSNLLGADLSSETSRAMSVEAVLSSDLSAEISRATAAENSIASVLSTEVSSIIANTDLTSIDSFAEVVANLSTEVARAESVEASIAYKEYHTYAKHVAVNEVPNGSRTTFTLATPVKYYSELIYMNGLLLTPGEGEDYTLTYANGMTTGFVMNYAPLTGDKLKAYGVYQTSVSLYE
jgi:hypothetical protein